MLQTELPTGHEQRELPVPPLLTRDQALFLDVDGCLIELAPTPTEVVVPPWLAGLLTDLGEALDQAVAVISGRSLDVVDSLLAPWHAAGAGVHGAELRLPGSHRIDAAPRGAARIVERLRRQFIDVPGVLIEDKGAAVAIHFARCPEREAECEAALADAMRAVPGMRMQAGRLVREALPATADKGSALRTLMEHPPFAGRVPVFAGDDRTDEAAFAEAEKQRGFGVKVGAGSTAALYRLGTPNQVLLWLQASLASMRGENDE
ncbi:trehalose 6-phosphatase [Panacagrimonas perspica]|uniref:Trehalose 6-phosphate phosphatase n=1 Tax=Panacagrimonas perspica TaxID=381431 RepID=A0A4R7P3E5_9GAMM|nr:trehalose 6-phosphatase [Panacagrimonas perspica]THD04319.1 trehalose-phosphatase [Panacagrimonas perspica]